MTVGQNAERRGALAASARQKEGHAADMVGERPVACAQELTAVSGSTAVFLVIVGESVEREEETANTAEILARRLAVVSFGEMAGNAVYGMVA